MILLNVNNFYWKVAINLKKKCYGASNTIRFSRFSAKRDQSDSIDFKTKRFDWLFCGGEAEEKETVEDRIQAYGSVIFERRGRRIRKDVD